MLPTKRIIFRADGNSRIGLGHVVRSLALASMLQDDFECVLVIQEPDPTILSNLAQAGIKFISLPATQQYQQEATALIKILNPSDIVVLDGYAFTTAYQQIIKAYGNKLVCLDDIHAFPFVADVIINQAGGVIPELYEAEPYTRYCLGPNYALLRAPFLEAAKQTREITQIKSILLNMGGADPDNHTLYLLQSVLVADKQLIINVVIGSAYAYREQLTAFAQAYPEITIHQNLDASEMCRLMQRSDAAILPPSSVSYEWCSVSGPLFLHQIADNQQDIANFLIRTQLAFPLAEFRNILNQSEKAIIIEPQINRQRQYFDGQSKHRLQRLFFDLAFQDSLRLRKAQDQDMTLLFKWANDPEVRRHSFNPSPIPQAMHQSWFRAKLNDPDCLIFIAFAGDVPAGMIRYDIIEKQATISYLLNKDFRGKGLGSWILAAGTEALRQQRPDVRQLIGQVQTSNIASIVSFRKTGFAELTDGSAVNPKSLVFAKSLN
ncbi:MAG: glycosyltransferase [Adhaeribacter sp.]|nr:glycosyltransferase [Adhaeribacter sp.]